jgi:hypothetical protein
MTTVIDGTNNSVVYTIPVGAYPSGIDLNPQTNKIYVASSAEGAVYVVDGFSKTFVNIVSLAMGTTPGAVGVNPATNEIYVANGGPRNTLSVISGRSTATSLSCNPSSLAVNSNTICTATVTDTSGSGSTTPTGLIYFSSNGMGSFAIGNCTLTGSGTTASCSASYSPTRGGSQGVFGTYSGSTKHMSSSGTFAISVSTQDSGGGGGSLPKRL